jgi:PAS domain S-box-containing protein
MSEKPIVSSKQHAEAVAAPDGMADQLPDLIWETTTDLSYSYVNARSLDVLGYEPFEMVGRSMLDFLPEDESRRVADLLASLSAAAAPFQLLEKTMRHKDGTLVIVQSSGIPRTDFSGRHAGYQGIDRDVTARWQAEKRLRENLTSRLRAMISKTTAARSLVEHARQLEEVNAELLRRNKQLDELSYMSSHDLQEPLRHLLIFTSRLEQHLAEAAHEKVAADMETIRRSASRMRRTLLDVQKLTWIERVALSIQPVPVSQCVQRVLASLKPAIDEVGATVAVSEMPTILADEALLVTLIEHLITNALKFSRRPPAINLTAEKIDDDWVLGVKDQGPGIDPRYTDRIFRPFERLGLQRSDIASGMGLAICRTIVERHGGEIWVESVPEQGAHFKFKINAAGPTKALAPTQRETPAEGGLSQRRGALIEAG